jgi:hypothetical protein
MRAGLGPPVSEVRPVPDWVSVYHSLGWARRFPPVSVAHLSFSTMPPLKCRVAGTSGGSIFFLHDLLWLIPGESHITVSSIFSLPLTDHAQVPRSCYSTGLL